ncbi:MAG: hypothetical protein ACRD2O_09985, partial [Terriglobia bacterium]
MEVDRKGFEDTVASAQALETAIQAEGIGLEIEPERTIRITVQTDNGSEVEVDVGTTQKFAARRAISVHVPGLGRLRLTNESSTAQQLEQGRRQIAGALSQASASGVDDLLEQFRHHDELAAHLTETDTRLQVVLGSRAKEDWKQEAVALTEQLNTISGDLDKLASARELQTVEKELSDHQKQLNQLERDRTESVTRLNMLTSSLSETQSTLRDRQQNIVVVQQDIEAVLQRANQKDVT